MTRNSGRLAALAFLALIFGTSARAIDCTGITDCAVAASLSKADIFAAELARGEGGTVILPAGTGSWTEQYLLWYHSITFIGQTTCDSVTGVCDDQTIILDDVPRDSGQATPLWIQPLTGKTIRVSGVTFRPGAVTDTATTGMIVLAGPVGSTIRFDHNHLDNPCLHDNQAIRTYGAWYGVIDHNVAIFSDTGASNGIYFEMGDFGGHPYGNGSWAEPAYYGSEKFVFVEDNYWKNATGEGLRGGFDGEQGCRMVFRYNHFYDVSIIPHGTDSGAYRGSRAIEVYNNDFHWTTAITPIGIRTGSFISHNNTNSGVTPSNNLLQNYRLFVPFPPWLASDGTNSWDENATESNGAHVDGHSPYMFASGTVASGSTTTLVVVGTPWTAHQWQGFSVKRVSDGGYNVIQDNTNNTLSFLYTDAYGTQTPTWAGGDSYEIHKPLIVLDQPGRGAGDLLDASDFANPVNSATGTVAWPNQALEPVYEWDDDGQVVTVHPTNAGLLTEGRDYYNGTPLPDYTPYTYPHPLVTGATPTPTPTPTPHKTAMFF